MGQRRLLRVLREVRACTLCAEHLPGAPRPLLAAHARSRLVIIGQAPGRRAREAARPWADASGVRLRAWLGLSEEEFYDPRRVAIVPMGFCYPGQGRGGDLPPRPECAPRWHPPILAELSDLRLTLVIGRYALERYLGLGRSARLTSAVEAWATHLERGVLPLPHPSPRNNRWLKRNPWFAREVLPVLQERCAALRNA